MKGMTCRNILPVLNHFTVVVIVLIIVTHASAFHTLSDRGP